MRKHKNNEIEYFIAYKNKEGNDFNGYPWLLRYDSLEDLYDDLNDLNDKYISEYIIFSAKSGEVPPITTWAYAKSHEINH